MTTATAIQHMDVRGNMLYYIKLTNGTSEHLINVGKKTHDAVVKLQMNEHTLMPDESNNPINQPPFAEQKTEKNDKMDSSKDTTRRHRNR